MYVETVLVSTRFLRLKIGCGTWIRTKILGFKGPCPTIRRSRKENNNPCLRVVLRLTGRRAIPQYYEIIPLSPPDFKIVLPGLTAGVFA